MLNHGFSAISTETKIQIYELVLADYKRQFTVLKVNKPQNIKIGCKYKNDKEKQQAKEYRRKYQYLCNNINAISKKQNELIKTIIKGE